MLPINEVNFVTYLWAPHDKYLPKIKNGFSYETKHYDILVNRIIKTFSSSAIKPVFHLFTNLSGLPKAQVNIYPIPKEFFDFGRCYGRLEIFSWADKYLSNKLVCQIDIDMIPLPGFDEIFTDNHGFYKVYLDSPSGLLNQVNGGFYYFTAGDFTKVSKTFKDNSQSLIENANYYIGSDQAVLTYLLDFEEINFIPSELIISLKELPRYSLRRPRKAVLISGHGSINMFSLKSFIKYPFISSGF